MGRPRITKNTPRYGFELKSLADNFHHHLILESFISPPECNLIKKMAEEFPEETAAIGGENHVASTTRDSTIRWIGYKPEHNWLWAKIEQAAHVANDRHWGFDLIGCLEDLQFTQYDAPGGHYVWHMDYGVGDMSKRKLSMTIQLTDPAEYEGGELELFYAQSPFRAPRSQGSICLFPSYTMHRVLPVTSGTRHSLVVWISGPHSYR